MHPAIELYDVDLSVRRSDLEKLVAGQNDSGTLISTFADPGTVVTVAKVIAALYKMKTREDAEDRIEEALQEISDKLTQIDNRLTGITLQLDDVIDRLEKIGIAIEEVPYKTVLLNQRGLVRGIALNVQGWKETIDSERTINEIGAALHDLNRHNQSLMTGGFSYAFDVLLGFSVELDLHILLRSEASRFKATVESVLAYIDQSLDLGVPKSMAERAVLLEATIKALKADDAELDRSDRFLGRTGENNCADDGYWWTQKHWCRLEGDLDSRYKVVHFSTDFKDGYCRGDGGFSIPVGNFALIQCPHNVEELNETAKKYRLVQQSYQLLEKIMEQMKDIRAKIDARMDWHQSAIG